ncbi:MAG TPA: DUF4928 family protein [Capsulimonadaceae bacterium]|jgi:hypothetical protein
MIPLYFDRYRTVAWNVGIVLTQVQLADQLDGIADSARTTTVIRTMAAAYLDLLAHEFPVIVPHLPADVLTPDALLVESHAIYRDASPSPALISRCAGDLTAGVTPVIVTVQSAVVPTDGLARDAGLEGQVAVYSVEQFLTGLVLKDIVMGGLAWRSCVVKFLNAYNFLIESSGNPAYEELLIEARK